MTLRAGRGRAAGDRPGRGEGELLHARRRAALCAGARAGDPPAPGRGRPGGAAGRRERRRRLAHGRRVHPLARRGRHRHARHAHSRHQPQPVGARCRRRWRRRCWSSPRSRRSSRKIGTAEVATDPMPPNVADNFIMLKPRAEWPDPDRPKADLVAAIEKRAAEVPGNNYEFTQPIQMRFNELISGVRSDLGVKIFGDDLDTLLSVAAKVQSVVQGVPGAADVKHRAGQRPADADREAQPRRPGALRHQPGRRCRRPSRSPSAARRPACCSRATAASTSSCACPSICGSTSMPWRSLPIPAAGAGGGRGRRRPARSRADRHRHGGALRAAVGRGRDRDGAGPQPDQPRERQAARRGHRQRARPRPRLVRGRGAARGRRAR